MWSNWLKPALNALRRIQVNVVAMACLALLVALGFSRGQAIAADRPPNIVWLVQDHVPWRQYTATGGPKPVLPTFERLAQNGIVFQRAISVTPLCAPARGTMMTGAYPHNHGITGNDDVVRWKSTFYPEYKAFNQYLQVNGYEAGYFGKYHAGPVDPKQLGFEGYSPKGYGDPYTTPEYAKYLSEHGLPKPSVVMEWQIGSQYRFNGVTKNVAPTSNGGMAGKLTSPFETHESYFVASLASDWITQRVKSGDDKPFVLRVDTWGPHQPYLVSEPFQNLINPKDIPEYPSFKNNFADRPLYQQRRQDSRQSNMAMPNWSDWQPLMARIYENFSQTDTALLQVLDTLEKNGLMDNTIIIYTADHGDITGSGGGLFDKDAFMTEEVMSIPMVVKWPGVTDGGGKTDAFVSNLDVVPTVLEMAGVNVPDAMDGQSMVPLIKDPEGAPKRESFMAEHFGHLETKVFQRALYFEHYKYVAHLNDKSEFYDLTADPFELKNRIDDPTVQPVLDDMKAKLVKQMMGSGDDSEDAKKLIDQMGVYYATATYLDQDLRISIARDTYSIELPYGTTSVPELSVLPIVKTGVQSQERQLKLQVKPATALPGEAVIDAYDTSDALVHSVRLQFSVADKPTFEVKWGDLLVSDTDPGFVTVQGIQPFSINSTTQADQFTGVEVKMTPVVDGDAAPIQVQTLYAGKMLPHQVPIDSGLLADGTYEMQVRVTLLDGSTFTEQHKVIISNWNVVLDILEPAQESGWFGTIKRRSTVQESDGWVSVTEPSSELLGDGNRLAAKEPLPQYLIWEAPALQRFTATLFVRDITVAKKALSFGVSPDMQTWQVVPTQVVATTSLSEGWHKVTILGELGDKSSARYLRVQVENTTVPLSDLQLGEVQITSPKQDQ